MNPIICRLLTAFIVNKKKRKQFRAKHLKERNWDILSLYNYCYFNEFSKIYHTKIFEKYRGLYRDKEVVLFATGPTARYFTTINNAINVGINYAFLKEDISFDYIFVHDAIVMKTHKDSLMRTKAKKFLGFHVNMHNAEMFNTCSRDVCDVGADRFFISDPTYNYLGNDIPDVVNPDITKGLFLDRGGGTVFSALQFVLFTNPKRIYLVGCDCTEVGHFYNIGEKNINLLPNTMHLWKEFSYIKKSLYPDVEVVSINPVGLKSVFKDVYTHSYVNEHPYLNDENVEIIDAD